MGADCLPTPLNLSRWKYQVDSKCPLCKSLYPTTSHILNGCHEALMQGRFTWRHDSVLNVLASSIWKLTPPSSKLFADISSWRASDSPPFTLPTNISTTTSRPDLVLIEDKMVYILELTVPSNNKEALHAAYLRKSNKSSYLEVINDLENRDLSVVYKTLEIGSLGNSCNQIINSNTQHR